MSSRQDLYSRELTGWFDPALGEPRWLRRNRVMFIFAAAVACWAVPALVVYLLI